MVVGAARHLVELELGLELGLELELELELERGELAGVAHPVLPH